MGQKARRARKVAGQAEDQVRSAAAHPAVEGAARLGYVVRGIIYGTMGLLALGLAAGRGEAGDMKQSIRLLVSNPWGRAVLGGIIAGLFGYALWGYVRFVFDPLKRGDDASGWVQRLGFLWSGLSYSGLLVFAIQFGLGSPDGADPLQALVAGALNHRLGAPVVAVAGVIGVLVGLGQFVDGVRAGFRRDLMRRKMSPEAHRLAVGLGRLGMFARGVIFSLLGWFVVEAALRHDPQKVRTMGGAFQALAGQPVGHAILVAVALGFIALGLHSLASARWIRMLSAA